MDGPIVRLLVRKCAQVHELERRNAELAAAAAHAEATAAAAVDLARQAKAAAGALWEIADPSLRDGVMATLEAIESLPEVGA